MEIYSFSSVYYVCEDNIRVECTDIADGIRRLEEAKKYPVRYVDEEPPIKMLPHPYTVAQWIREKRNKLLAESDWVMLPDAPLSEEQRLEWMRYRQALRDLPRDWGLPKEGEIEGFDEKIDVVNLGIVEKREDVDKLPFPRKPV